ncbi:MAG: DUF2281 domain-containing protein [Treponema sp.]|nr:DUF2281 domain-containing protein [Treponema sp.]MEE3314148.1 DUF2281 domain-containing protein [Treponema sp.]
MQAAALRNEAFKLFNTMSDSKLRTVIQFARFISQQPDDEAETNTATPSSNMSQFGSLRDRIKYVAPDFDEPIDDFAEYM